MLVRQRGDTIVEVLFAVAVFSLVAVSGMAVMNRGVATAQRSLEIDLVRHQMDGQAEALRFLHKAYIAEYGTAGAGSDTAAQAYKKIKNDYAMTNGATASAHYGEGESCSVSGITKKLLTIDPKTVSLVAAAPVDAETYARVVYNGADIPQPEGIWVEPTWHSGGSSGQPYIDFHIRTCWDSPGSPQPMRLATIVRLYEPK